MTKDVQVIARIEPSLKRRLHKAKRESGMSVKAMMRRAIIEYLDRQKPPEATTPT